jgi:hypothetical protein
MSTPMNSADDHESVHGHESSPGPDGRIPSSTGWPNITIKTPGPEMHDPRAAEAESQVAPAGTPPNQDDFPVIERDDRSGAASSES